MDRRTVVQTTTATLIVGWAGCLGDNGTTNSTENTTETNSTDTNQSQMPSENETNTDNTVDEPVIDSNMIDSTADDSTTFTRTGECDDSSTATVDFTEDPPSITVTGCVEGHNGCAEPVFVSATDVGDKLQIEISEADLSEPDMICTQAIVQRGYELVVRFTTELPATVEVVHDDVGGREVVTTVDRP